MAAFKSIGYILRDLGWIPCTYIIANNHLKLKSQRFDATFQSSWLLYTLGTQTYMQAKYSYV